MLRSCLFFGQNLRLKAKATELSIEKSAFLYYSITKRVKTTRIKYGGYLEEFLGYFIRNEDKGCCLSWNEDEKNIHCVFDSKVCLKVKDKNNR